MRTNLAVALALTACLSTVAQKPQITVLQHARILDGNGGPAMEDATLVVEGRTLRSVGAAQDVTVPRNAKKIDLSGKTVMPGLISDHSHLGQTKDGTSGPGLYTRENLLQQLTQWQAYGVTTITSLGLNDPAVFYPMRAEAHAGTLAGSDFYGADRGIGVPNGAPPVKADPGPYRPATPEEARAAVRDMAARHTDLIKVWVDDFHGSVPAKMSPDVYAAVIDEAHAHHLRVAAHIYYLADAKQLVRDGIDILAHGVRDQPVDDEFISLMKQHGTWYIATLDLDECTYLWAQHPPLMDTPFFQHALTPGLRDHLDDPAWKQKILTNSKLVQQSKDSLAQNERNLKHLHDAGIHIGFGTDSGANPERIPGFAEHRELHLSVDAGLTPGEAITMATRDAAALLQLTDRGTLAAGKRADFVVLDADPTADINNADKIDAVWHNGQPVSGPVARYQAH